MKVTKFQIIVLSCFALFIIVGVAVFATYKGSSQDTRIPPITVWGTLPKSTFDKYVNDINITMAEKMTISYVQEPVLSFLSDFVAALARGTGPDVVLISSDILLPTEDKLTPIPYTVLPPAKFQNDFVDEARVYLGPSGVLGVPFSVDPMVMYWNRDLFNSAGIATPPRYWDEFKVLNDKLTIKDENGNIQQSAVAMGDFTNVDYARELLATLIFQAGNNITARGREGGVVSTIGGAYVEKLIPVIRFFAQSVDPTSVSYSWNRSWSNSKAAFLSGKLATYFGLASELRRLRERNPNLNFDASPMPQNRTGGFVAIYGKIHAFSIVKSSQNVNAAYQIISILTSPQNLMKVSNESYLPSVSRAVIASGSNDPYISIFNNAALISRSWLDSDPTDSGHIFAELIQAVTSGQKSYYQALGDAGSLYDVELRKAMGLE